MIFLLYISKDFIKCYYDTSLYKKLNIQFNSLIENLKLANIGGDFKLDNIFVIDGSKRSTKANAYFSGFGSQKRITLFDTLINDLETDEIVAVLAHEVGHYKRKHIIFNLVTSTLIAGFTLYILSLFINSPFLYKALSVSKPSFHIGLVAFGILYSPISEITGLFMNYVSRKFEYQADDFAKETFAGNPLITSLKKLSKNSFDDKKANRNLL